MSCGLQAEAGGSAVKWNASADLTGWIVLHFTFESAVHIVIDGATFTRAVRIRLLRKAHIV